MRPRERRLLVRGEPAPIGSRAFDVLLALIEGHGNVVRKSELLDVAWPGLVVEENNVSVQIAALRKLLGPEVISTAAGLGYRLSAVPDPQPADAPVGNPSIDGATGPVTAEFAASELIGRETDLDALGHLLDRHRLVSVVGTGGVGKTSLVKSVVQKRVSRAGEAVFWVDLAPLRDAELLVPLLGKTLGIDLDTFAHARGDLISALSQMRGLIVLDNCEHLIRDVAEFIHHTLDKAHALRWLATSQERLRLAGEVVYNLGPLNIPADDSGVEEAMRHGAIALLCQRVGASDRRFALTTANVRTAIDLCRQLDGLPLAIEMAAARVSTLGLATVHEQLGQRLHLLTGPRHAPDRHHTLRETFEWSHGLLSPEEQKVFRRLQIFVGGFNASMAQQLAGEDDGARTDDATQVIESLSALIDKSLVHCSDAPGRYHLFESARDYAALRLAEAGETEALRRRHAHVVASWFSAASAEFVLLSDEAWAARYIPERHNLRAALAWACRAQEPDVLAILVSALAQIDSFVQSQAEIVRCDIPMDILLGATPPLRAMACVEFSWAHYAEGNREIGTELSQRALEDFRQIGDVAGEYRALAQLVRLYESRPGMIDESLRMREQLRRLDASRLPLRTRLSCTLAADLFHEGKRTPAHLRELEVVAEQAGFGALAAICRVHITDALLVESRFEEAIVAAQRYIDAGEPRPRLRALILTNQALALIQLGRTREAGGPAREALRALPSFAPMMIDTFALAASRTGQFVEAAMMAGYGRQVRSERDASPDAAEAEAIAETLYRLASGLPADRVEELMRLGSAMSISGVLAIAIPAGASTATDASS